METIEGRRFGEERALYGSRGCVISGCSFEGPEDGESALKESRDITVRDCRFSLRYPMWHCTDLTLKDSTLGPTVRAALWYVKDAKIVNCTMQGVKAVRECDGMSISDCSIDSDEFGWKCRGLSIKDSKMTSEYAFLDSEDVDLERVELKGKYSFQYVEGLHITDSILDTKDAFWHSKGATVEDSIVKGEYLGWYSEGLTLRNCRIIGTQPLCYCKGLRLIDCTMEGCDLSFEYSDVQAEVTGAVDSVKNPLSGRIVADSFGKIITERSVKGCSCEIVRR